MAPTTTPIPDNKITETLQTITQILLAANGAIPLVAGAVGAIALIIRGVTGKGPGLKELPDLLQTQITKTGQTIDANLAAAIQASVGLPEA